MKGYYKYKDERVMKALIALKLFKKWNKREAAQILKHMDKRVAELDAMSNVTWVDFKSKRRVAA